MEDEFDFVRFLKKEAVIYDKSNFMDWDNKAITTEMALRRFIKSNAIPINYYIDPTKFILWLHSLGYRREVE